MESNNDKNLLHLQGYLVIGKDDTKLFTLLKGGHGRPKDIISSIKSWASSYYNYTKGHLGGTTRVFIDNLSIRIYATEEECCLEDAYKSLVFQMYRGLDIETELIGGYDLKKELSQYIGKYIHLLIERKWANISPRSHKEKEEGAKIDCE